MNMAALFAILVFVGTFLLIFLPMCASVYNKHNEEALKKPDIQDDWRKKVDLKIVTKQHTNVEEDDRKK